MTTELKNAILKQIGISETEFKDNILDYFDANNGVSGFTYYSETHEFAMANKNLINEYLEDYADELGMTPFELVISFRTLKDNLSKEDLKDIHGYLSGFDCDLKQGSITNVLSWFCLESLAFELDQ
jgi:hypothetical protein